MRNSSSSAWLSLGATELLSAYYVCMLSSSSESIISLTHGALVPVDEGGRQRDLQRDSLIWSRRQLTCPHGRKGQSANV